MRFKFIKIKDETDEFDFTDVCIKGESVRLQDIVEAFNLFLKASGFDYAQVEVVENEE